MHVTAVVVNWKRSDLTATCVGHLIDASYEDLDIIVVDNEANGETREALHSGGIGGVHVIELTENHGYAGAATIGMSAAVEGGADAVLLINNDCRPHPKFLHYLVDEMKRDPRVGATGPLLRSVVDGMVVWTNGGQNIDMRRGLVFADGVTGDFPRRPRAEVGFVGGACTLFRSSALEDVGYFDPRLFLFSEEADWSIRARRKGWVSSVVSDSLVDHTEKTTTGGVPAARTYFLSRNAAWIVRRHGTRTDAFVHMLLTLFWKMPKIAAGHLRRGDRYAAWASVQGSLAGLFADCRRGYDPSSALSEARFELAR